MNIPKSISLAKKIDNYIENLCIPNNDILQFTLKNSKKNNLPPIHISPVIANFLSMQVSITKAKKVLEIGTLGGYSTLWLALALPLQGEIVTIEYNQEYASVAYENFRHAKKENMITLLVGDAKEILPTLSPSFDLIFIDANKEDYAIYFDHALRLAKKETLIICDNVIRNGGVLQKKPKKEYYKILADFNKKITTNLQIQTTILPITVPLPGRDYIDGISISRVL